MAQSKRRYGGRLERRLVGSAKAGAENGATQAVFMIAGTLAFGFVIGVWKLLQSGGGA